MTKIVTRSLYIDGQLIACLTQQEGATSDLERIENIVAKLQLHKQSQRGCDVTYDIADGLDLTSKSRLKTLKLKLKLLYILAKKLFLGNKTSMENHVVCLCIERNHDMPSETSGDPAQA